MKVKDGRGQNRVQEALKNKQNVKKWFLDNPDTTIKECCESLCLAYHTVRKHIDSLNTDA